MDAVNLGRQAVNEALCPTKYVVYSVVPIEEMTKQMPLPGLFLRFIALCEVLGAIGLILPGLLRIRPGLTPLAPAELVIIMIGATVVTVMTGDVAMALIPLVVGAPRGVRRLRPLAPFASLDQILSRLFRCARYWVGLNRRAARRLRLSDYAVGAMDRKIV